MCIFSQNLSQGNWAHEAEKHADNWRASVASRILSDPTNLRYISIWHVRFNVGTELCNVGRV